MRPRHAAAVALAAGTSLSAAALAMAADGAPGTAGAPGAARAAAPAGIASPTARVADRRLRFGQHVVVAGRVAAAARGGRVELQYAPSGRDWRRVESGRAGRDGSYRLAAELHRTGKVRVVAQASAVAAGLANDDAAAASEIASRSQRVAVAGRLAVKARSHDALAGQRARVAGVLLPRGRGRRVTVQARVNGRWRDAAHARTRANGHFSARVAATRLGTTPLRVRFAGSRTNAPTTKRAGSISGYRASTASWYSLPGGTFACGGTMTTSSLGVAHKSLPCGTKVTIRYRGREITVPVVDRGPFVGDREWDLTGGTARALGFGGVGTIWTTV